MRFVSTGSDKVSVRFAPELMLLFAMLAGAVWGCAVSMRFNVRVLFPSLSVADRSLPRIAIISLLFPFLVYVFASCFGKLPTAILFFCKATFLSMLLYCFRMNGAVTQIVFLLAFHSLLPLPMYFHTAAELLSGNASADSFLPMLISALLTFLAELYLSRFGSIF